MDTQVTAPLALPFFGTETHIYGFGMRYGTQITLKYNDEKRGGCIQRLMTSGCILLHSTLTHYELNASKTSSDLSHLCNIS